MGKHPWRSVALLIAGLGAMSLPARAALFEFQWAHKWGAGQISHHTGVADSDPSSLRDVFLGAIDAYQFYSYSIDENQAIAFSGVGGTLQVEHVRSRPGEDGCPDTGVAGCVTDTFTFLLGMPDAPPLRLVASTWTVPYGGAWGSPARWSLDAAWEAPMNGTIQRGEPEQWLGAMGDISWTRHVNLAAPVPEPAAFGLLAAGLAVMAVTGRRRRAGAGTRRPHEVVAASANGSR